MVSSSKESKYKKSIEHISVGSWEKANKIMVKRILTEFSHEEILKPKLLNDDCFVINIENKNINYYFSAEKYWLDHLDINIDSIKKLSGKKELPLDALSLIIEIRDILEINNGLLPVYLDKIKATLNSWAYKLYVKRPDIQSLIHSDYQCIESAMNEGHPVMVVNNGRHGFDAVDYGRFTPECQSTQKLMWIAVHKSRAVFTSITSISYNELINSELSESEIYKFNSVIKEHLVSPEDYYWMPVHEWQWREKISTRFIPDIADKLIIFLGVSLDNYYVQQSVRTFFNLSEPHKCYVKTAISILNLGFMRGLSPDEMYGTPMINEWLDNVFIQDDYFTQKKFKLLKEIAAIGYRDTMLEEVIEEDIEYKNMLSALWRENPYPKMEKGQRLMTMASFLHTDKHGNAFVVELIKSSGLSAVKWIEAYLNVYLSPLLHAFYVYDLVFMPHGENDILVIEDNKPSAIFMKDIAEEIKIINCNFNLPEYFSRRTISVSDDAKLDYIMVDIFDGFFRHLAVILDKKYCVSQHDFWQLVANNVKDYQSEHPENKAKYEQFDLFQPEFRQMCYNRQQLRNNIALFSTIKRAECMNYYKKLSNPLYLFK